MEESYSADTQISDYYSSEALVEKYDSLADSGLTALERATIGRYFTDRDGAVLDLGCGTGRTTKALDQLGFDVTGVDLTPPFVDRARTLVPGSEFLVGDACSLPFRGDTFRYALFSYNGIDDIIPEENRYRALREIHRVLNPGGIFVFSSHNLWSTYVVRSLDFAGVRQYVEFWIRNIGERRLFSRYKSDDTVRGGPRPMYYIRPEDQKQQLRNCGFEALDVVRPDGILERRFHHPYYVARKPVGPGKREH